MSTNTNVILVHIGATLPVHARWCISQLKRFGWTVHLLANRQAITKFAEEPLANDVLTVPLETISSRLQQDFHRYNGFLRVRGELWSTAFERLFVLAAYLEKHSELTPTLHVENDVLMYSDPLLLDRLFALCKQSIGINPVGEYHFAFAYAFIPSAVVLTALCVDLLNVLRLGEKKIAETIGYSFVSEMTILDYLYRQKSGNLYALPSLPFGPGSEGANELGYLFDGASYGQFATGTTADPPGWATDQHYVGRELKQKAITLLWDRDPEGRRIPRVVHRASQNTYRLANLHGHSKNVSIFKTLC